MKRTFAAVVTAGISIWLVGPGTATAATATATPAPQPGATLRVVPKWTYQGSGKIAVITACSNRADSRVISSRMLPGPVTLRQAGDLLIKVTNKTHPGRYRIMLLCVGNHQRSDAADMKWVQIMKVLKDFRQPDPPPLPAHFKPAVIVSTGPHGHATATKGH
jgi:hypothetical protein